MVAFDVSMTKISTSVMMLLPNMFLIHCSQLKKLNASNEKYTTQKVKTKNVA